MRQHYTEEQANAILRRAVERMPMKDEMSRQQLESIATELGVSPESLLKAEAEWEEAQAEKADRAAFNTMRRHGFLRHLGVYFLANLLLFLMALASGKDESISLFFLSLIGWGIGLGIHASSALRTRGEEVETTFTRWRIERRAREIAVQELSQITPRRG